MSYLLNGIELKSPASLRVQNVDIAKDNMVLNGKKKRDFIRQKNIWTLDIRMVSQTDMADIMGIVHGMVPVTFAVSEEHLTIASTNVWVYFDGGDYTKAEYRENITLILEEV